jgi:predicted double-glycine peptidase
MVKKTETLAAPVKKAEKVQKQKEKKDENQSYVCSCGAGIYAVGGGRE